MKKLTTGKIWCFAIGQLGWSLLAALISNWLVFFYQPDKATIASGHAVLIPQSLCIFGVFTILGAITAFGRIFDAITDPLIASASDKCRSKNGRRIPFMKAAAIPFALVTVLIFWSPIGEESWFNAGFLFVMLTLFYLFMTMYCTPYNALIPELGNDQKKRMSISTAISFTYIAGTAIAYTVPVIVNFVKDALSLNVTNAYRVTFIILSIIGLICLFVPVFTIKEKDYINVEPSKSTAIKSLAATFKNKEFLKFVASDISYFLGITMFQTALPFFVTSLLEMDASYATLFFVLMTALSVVFYVPVSMLTPKLGKKKLILIAFVIFTISFIYTAFFGKFLPIPPFVQGIILCVVAAPAMAIFGILPQAVVADISEFDALDTGENRSGMFYAARTFAFKMGQSAAMLIVTALATIGADTGLGYRIIALSAAGVCFLGGIIFKLYDEKKIYSKIIKEETVEENA